MRIFLLLFCLVLSSYSQNLPEYFYEPIAKITEYHKEIQTKYKIYDKNVNYVWKFINASEFPYFCLDDTLKNNHKEEYYKDFSILRNDSIKEIIVCTVSYSQFKNHEELCPKNKKYSLFIYLKYGVDWIETKRIVNVNICLTDSTNCIYGCKGVKE